LVEEVAMVLPPDAELCLVGDFNAKVVDSPDIVCDRILELFSFGMPWYAWKAGSQVGRGVQ
jgi:hypothetical protein